MAAVEWVHGMPPMVVLCSGSLADRGKVTAGFVCVCGDGSSYEPKISKPSKYRVPGSKY